MLVMVLGFGWVSSGQAFAQASGTVEHATEASCSMAVLDLKPGDGFSDQAAATLTDFVSSAVAKHSPCSVLSRNEIRAVLSYEAEKQLIGCTDDSCMAELGGALGVDYLIVGSVSKMGESTMLSLKQIDLATIKVTRRFTDTSLGIDEEIAAFTTWMATRLAAGDEVAGPKPVIKERKKTVQLVDRESTIWRKMAWTGLALTSVAALATAATVGGTYGLSAYAEWTKQQQTVDQQTLDLGEKFGDKLALSGNIALYTSLGLALTTVVLFLLPGEQVVSYGVDAEDVPAQANKPQAAPAASPSTATKNAGGQS